MDSKVKIDLGDIFVEKNVPDLANIFEFLASYLLLFSCVRCR
jgi:hypothetical protein